MKYFTLVLLFVSLNAYCQIESETENAPQTEFEAVDTLEIEPSNPVVDTEPTRPIIISDTLTELNETGEVGSLVMSVSFDYNSDCFTNNLILASKKDTIKFFRFQENDTLNNVPSGNYEAHIYDCDSSHNYTQQIEIVAGSIIQFNYYNNSNVGIVTPRYDNQYDEMYTNHQSLTTVWVNHGMQFGRGLDYDNESVKVESDYSFQYSIGQDFRLSESPFALGYEFGGRYSQSNFEKTDFVDTAVVHEQYRFSNSSLSAAFLVSIYARDRKFMDVGILYNLPFHSRIVAITGNEKTSIKNVHNFKDVRFVAHIGYWWGFIYGEYRPELILKTPYENAPKLTLGIRFNVPLEWW